MKKLSILLFLFSIVTINTYAQGTQIVYGPTIVCAEEAAFYNAVVNNARFYNWNVTNAQSFVPNGNFLDVVWGNYASGQITLIVEDSLRNVIYTNNINVTINPKPQPIIQTSSKNECVLYGEQFPSGCWTACQGIAITYSVLKTTGSTYDWIVVGGTLLNGNNTNTISVIWSNVGIGEIKMTETNIFGCEETVKQCVNAIKPPLANFNSVPATSNGQIQLCKNSTLYLTDNSTDGVEWDWDFGDGFHSSDRNTSHTYDIPGTYNLTMSVYNECRCIDTKTISVVISNTKGPEIICPSVVCKGDTATYHTTSICPNYSWNVTNGTIIGSNTDISVDVVWQSHTGFIELNTFNCPGTCPEKTAIKIPVISDDLAIKGNQNACFNEYETYYIDPIPEAIYNWTVSSTLGSIFSSNKNEIVVNITGAQGEVKLTIDHPIFGCINKDSIQVTALPKFEIISTENQFCSGDTAAFLSNYPVNWKVYNENSDVITYGSFSSTFQIVLSGYSPGSYYVETKANGYCNNFAHFPIEILPKPSKPAGIRGDTIICPSQSYEYSVYPKSNHTVVWDIVNGDPLASSGNRTIVKWNSGGNYKLKAYYVNNITGCSSDTTTINIQRSITSAPKIIGDTAICGGERAIFKTNFSADLYKWSIIPANAGSIVTNRYSDSVLIAFSLLDNDQNVIIRVSSSACGVDFDVDHTILVKGSPRPTMAISGINCPGNDILFQASQGAGWHWDFGDGDTSNLQNVTKTYTEQKTYVVKLTVKYPANNGCQPNTTISQQLTINSKAKVTISTMDQVRFCADSLSSPIKLVGSIVSSDTNSSRYSWYKDTTFLATGHNFTTVGNTSAYGMYRMKYTNPDGCISTSNAIYIKIDCSHGDSTNYPPCVTLDSVIASFGLDTACNNTVYLESISYPSGYTLIDLGVGWHGDGHSGIPGTLGPYAKSYTYTSLGIHHIRAVLTLIDPDGDTCFYKSNFTIYQSHPSADFSYKIDSCTLGGMYVTFYNKTSYLDTQPSYQWTIGAFSSTTANPSMFLIGKSYNVTLVAITGSCTTTVSRTIKIPTPANISFTHTTPVCQQEPVQFEVVPHIGKIINYYWKLGGKNLTTPTVKTTFENPLNYSQQLNPDIILYTQDSSGCHDTTEQKIYVNGNELISSVPSIAPNSPADLCEGDSLQFYIMNGISSPHIPVNYLWSDLNQTATTWAKQNGEYGVRISDAAGCRLQLPPVYLTVYSNNPPIIYGKTTYCAGDSIKLWTYNDDAIGYYWHINGVFSTDAYLNRLETSLAAGNYSIMLLATNSNTQCSDSAFYDITVLPPPMAPVITANVSQPYCEKQPITFTAFSPDAVAYNWNGGQSGNTIVVNKPDVYKATVTDSNGCSSSDSTFIHPLPDFTHFLTGCYCFLADENAPIVHGPDAATYQWYLGKDAVAAPAGVADSFRTEPGLISLIATTQEGCVDTSGVLDVSLFPCTNCTLGLNSLEVQCAGRDANGKLKFEFAMNSIFAGTNNTNYFITTTINGFPTGSVSQLNTIGLQNGTKPLSGVLTLDSALETDIVCFEVTAVDENFGICRRTICAQMPTAICEITPNFTLTVDELTCVATVTNTSVAHPCTTIDTASINWVVTFNGNSHNYNGNSFFISHLSGNVKVCMAINGYDYSRNNDCHPDLCKSFNLDWPDCDQECMDCEIEASNINYVQLTGNGCEFEMEIDLDNFGPDLTYIGGNSAQGTINSFIPTYVPSGVNRYSFTFTRLDPDEENICIRLFFKDSEDNVCCITICFEVPPCSEGRKRNETNETKNTPIGLTDFRIIPNPATDYFTILWQPFSGVDVVKVSIYDLHYNRIKTVNLDNSIGEHRFNTIGFANGVYLIVLETPKQRISQQLIINAKY